MSQLLSLSPNLMVDNVTKSIDFYSKNFGFELINSMPGEGEVVWAMMKQSNVTIMFHEKKNMTDEYHLFANKNISATMVLYIVVDDVKAFYKTIEPSLILKELHTTFYKMQEFSVKDHQGYVLTFAQPEA